MKSPTEPDSISTPSSHPQTIAEAVQPFVDRGLIAGAVVLAATKDKVLALEAYGRADLAAPKADGDRRAVLDRLDDEADDLHRADDAGR